MAYMHKKTFEILEFNSLTGALKNYFSVDETIAVPIQILNKKGYLTEFCCAGHAFETINWLKGEFSPEDSTSDILAMFRGAYKIKKVGIVHYVYFRDFLERNCYITFKQGISLPSIPDGFCLDVNSARAVINFEYKEESEAYDFFTERLEVMKRLYDWAVSLPDYTEEVQP